VIVILYLAKQLEAASSSSDKSAKRMAMLTWAIVFLGVCQILIALID
jgi:hypothetical protein